MKVSVLKHILDAIPIVLLVSFSSSAQAQNNISGKDKTYASCCLKDFDLAGSVKKMKILSYDYENGEKASIPKSDCTYNFDVSGNCISAYLNDYTFSYPTHQKIEYSYDASGNVLTEVYTEDGEFLGKKRYQYDPFTEIIYDKANCVEETISWDRKGSYSNSGFNGTLTENHTDSKGNVVSKIVNYYKDGLVIKEEDYSENSISHTTVYTYDTNGNMLLSKTSDTSGQVTQKEVNTYNEGALASTELYILFSTLDIAKAYRYDTKGREIYYCCYMVLPDYLIQNITYEDDSHGNWKKQWIRDRNNQIVEIVEREIEYY